MIFTAEQRDSVKRDNPSLQGATAIAKKLGEIWRGMDEKQKKPYQEKAEKDKQRYEKEMDEYLKKKK